MASVYHAAIFRGLMRRARRRSRRLQRRQQGRLHLPTTTSKPATPKSRRRMKRSPPAAKSRRPRRKRQRLLHRSLRTRPLRPVDRCRQALTPGIGGGKVRTGTRNRDQARPEACRRTSHGHLQRRSHRKVGSMIGKMTYGAQQGRRRRELRKGPQAQSRIPPLPRTGTGRPTNSSATRR